MRRVLLCLLLVSAVVLAGCAGEEGLQFQKEEKQFQLEEWKVDRALKIGTQGVPALKLKFSAKNDTELILLNPDGKKVDLYRVKYGMTEAELEMSVFDEVTPKPGTYTLIVKDPTGKQIDTYKFDFKGAKLQIVGVEPDWDHMKILKTYLLSRLTIKVKNTGDLPAVVTKAEVNLDGKKGTVYYAPTACLLPNESRIYYLGGVVSGVMIQIPEELSGDTYNLTVTLKDSGSVLATYSTKVTVS